MPTPISPSSIRSYIRQGKLKAFRVAGLRARKVLIAPRTAGTSGADHLQQRPTVCRLSQGSAVLLERPPAPSNNRITSLTIPIVQSGALPPGPSGACLIRDKKRSPEMKGLPDSGQAHRARFPISIIICKAGGCDGPFFFVAPGGRRSADRRQILRLYEKWEESGCWSRDWARGGLHCRRCCSLPWWG